MAVKFSKVLQTSTVTKMPTTSAVNWTEGFNAGAGSMEYLMLRGDIAWDADPVADGDTTCLVDTIRVICNGEVLHDFRSGYKGTTAGLYGYFLNSIGGAAQEVTSGTTDREFYWAIPLGRTYANTDVVRMEIVIGWAATDGAAVNPVGTLEWWIKYNTNVQTQTTVAPSTSFSHGAAISQVIVKVPQNAPKGSVVSAILVQNDTAADELGTQGIRLNNLSSYGFPPQMTRFLNGDMNNGIVYHNGAASTDQQYFSQLQGVSIIPCYGLAGGDITLQVDSSEVTIRTYTPILTAPVGGKEAAEVRQTQPQIVNTAKAILNKGTQ